MQRPARQDWDGSDGSESDDKDDEDDSNDDSGDGGTDGDDCACGDCTSDDDDDSARNEADALSNREPVDAGDDAVAAMVRACITEMGLAAQHDCSCMARLL